MHACVPSLVFAGVGLIIACVFVAVVNFPGLDFFFKLCSLVTLSSLVLWPKW